ncbi:putative riboflavin biosynthesis protein Rib7 [Wilcoxina mikolae CBS 423.85]|nr:putative riboflavin biosynthesis protein Rib7 [Wilcoxina mikolae CBS 423.85]
MSQPLTLPATIPLFLAPYLPNASTTPTTTTTRPFVTLTYATSLDSHLSLAPGVQTALSGPSSKALTHHLRTQHDAILIGTSTAVADDPGLNSRLPSTLLSAQPRPIVIDPYFRWNFSRDARVLKTAREGNGKAPYILISRDSLRDDDPRVSWLEEAGGKVVTLDPPSPSGWGWDYLLNTLLKLGIESVMVEGGGRVINELLRRENLGFVDSVVVTVAPVYLGREGVNVSPEGRDREAAVKFRNIEWIVLGRDVVMAARPDLDE